MPNKILNFDSWVNLEGRYNLEALGPPSPKIFSDVIVPVADADEALARDEIRTGTEDCSGAIGNHVPYFTVPDGEMWLAWMIHRPTTVGASEIQGLCRTNLGTFATVPLSIRNLAEVFREFTHLRLFQAGGGIGMRSTGNGGDSAISVQMWYRRFLVTGRAN